MHRLTAKLLLLFALVGNLIPLAMAITAAPPRACCRRMAHRCHVSAASEAEPVLRDPCCCNNHSRHPATTDQWAHPNTPGVQAGVPVLERLVGNSEFAFAGAQTASLHSSRAPPSFSIS
jgi:hypothetical protein